MHEQSPAWIQRSLRKAVLLPLLLMAALSILFYFQTRQLRELADWVEHSEAIIDRLHNARAIAIDMEASMRGYLLTGNRKFVEGFQLSRGQFPKAMDELHQLDRVSHSSGMELDAIRQHYMDWQRVAEAMIAQRVRGRGVLPFVQREAAMTKMKSLRDLLSRSISREEDSRAQRRQAMAWDLRLFNIVAVVALLTLGLIIALVVRGLIISISSSYNATQEDLRRSHAELEQRVKERTLALTAANSELEAFCYSVSHDLRSPLRGIDGFSQALLEDYGTKLDEGGRKYLGFIREGVQKMGTLIDDLLNLSRVNRIELKREEVSLQQLAETVAEELKRQRPDSAVEFRNLLPAEAKVTGDPGLLGALLENLLSNAWKFSSKSAKPLVQLGAKREGDETVYYVRDNGAGFDMEYRDKLFGAFQRLHSAKDYPGTGVGLATVRRIVHRHGGRIWAEGKVGQGASFYFTLA